MGIPTLHVPSGLIEKCKWHVNGTHLLVPLVYHESIDGLHSSVPIGAKIGTYKVSDCGKGCLDIQIDDVFYVHFLLLHAEALQYQISVV